MSLDPRTRDAIRTFPIELKALKERLEAVEKLVEDIHKFTRSTNESVVRKYSNKNTVKKSK